MANTSDAGFVARFPDHMNSSDAVMWDIEKDPVLRSTITAVAILDQSPDWKRLVEKLDRASREIPRLRQRVIVPPMRMGPPRWVVDPGFDLSYHVRRVRAPEPGDLRTVLDLAQPIAMAGFDRARPLWEFTLVEGLEDGHAALVQKLHHSLTDGVGGVELALHLFESQREPIDEGPMASEPPAGECDPTSVLTDALVRGSRLQLRSLLNAPGSIVRSVRGVVADPLGSARRARESTASLIKLVAPVAASPTPLIQARSLRRRLHTMELPMVDMKAAGHAAEGTMNDAFIAGVVEGLRRYHDRHDASVDELRLTMPISTRREGDDLGGNHFVPARFVVPATIDDPIERMRTLGAIARAWQAEPALAFSDTVATALDRLPVTVTTGFFGSMLKHIDAVVTNVPGLPADTYLAGAKVLRQYAFAPTTGAAINVALFSYGDVACIGVVIDAAAVPDDDQLIACLVEGFDDVLAAGGHAARRTA